MLAGMQLKSLTYTSLARLDLGGEDIADIHRTARQANALNGVTGLLIFNGTHFLQIIEGPESAIDELVGRLRLDQRHHQLEIRDERKVAGRQFPGWSMEFVRVASRYFEARDAIAAVLPADLPSHVADRILGMTERISGTVQLPD